MLLNIFEAPKITFEQLEHIDKSAPALILAATPFMVLFTIIEYYLAKKEEKDTYENMELKGSVLLGLGNLVSNALSKLILLVMVIVLYNLVPWRQEFVWWLFFPCYIVLDFCSYWAHRISHQQRFWWATHVPHHSANHYNLAVSFRLSWIQQFKIIFFAPVVLLGFHPLIFFVANQVAVLFQFWVHTEYIGRLHPWFEYIFATPSNHRVHHGTEDKYLDKNYGATFILWDRIFGTYQPEEERPTYGLTTPVHSGNPFFLVFHEVVDIARDVKSATTWKEKWWYIFGSPVKIMRFKKQRLARQKVEMDSVEAA